MAQKQYSFDFVLNAVLNGGFSGTFTKAQQEFIRLGTEIKNLQAIQRDVKAYEKQAAAVQNTSQKLENLKRQYELVNKQIGETTGSTTALEREKLKLEQRINNTEAALEKQRQKLGETKDRLDAAGVSTSDLAGKDAELTAKIQELTEEQKKAAEGAGEFGNAGVQAIEAVGGAIAAAGITVAMKSIADAYMECVEVAGNFEQAMSAVEAIANSNTSEMAALTAEAKELGATTKFTAQQSANAMEYMAMAGWDAREMLNGMDGVINLAAAAGEDLAQVSDIVTDNLSAFGLKASDTAHFADVLAAAAANSNTNISIMGETFKSSSSVAGALGYSIEDVAVMVGLMANNSVKGSRAGTALRNIFNGLLGGVTLTARAFGELDYSAVRSDGSMKGLMETVRDLRGYFDQMTEAEKVNNAMEIAGMRGYNGLLAILNATDESFQSLYQSVTDCTGAAERMAKVKLDNLNGDITLANSAMEALQSTIGEQFNPELRKLTQFGTEAINWANEFIQENESLSKGMMAATGTAIGLTGAIVGINSAIKAFQALKALGVFSGLTGGMFLAAGGAAALVGAVVAVVDATRDGGPAVREMTEAARELNTAMKEAEDSCEDTASSAIAAADVANLYIDKLEEMGDAAQLSGEAQTRYQNTLALLLQVMPGLSECISQTTDEYGRSTYALETDTAALRANTEEWKKNAQEQARQAYLNTLMEQYNGVLLEAAENELARTRAQYALADAQERRAAILKRMKELEAGGDGGYQGGYFDTDADAAGRMSEEYQGLRRSLAACNSEIAQYSKDVRDSEGAIEKDEKALAAAGERMSLFEETWTKLTGTMGLYTEENERLRTGEQAAQNVLEDTRAKVQELADAYSDAYEEAVESFSGQFGLFDEAKADADATVEAAQKALDTQLAYWQGYAGNIAALKELSAGDLGVTQENYDRLMEYVRNGTPEAAGLAADMVKAVNDGNTQALTDLANTLGEIGENQDQAAQDAAEWTTGLNEQMDQLVKDMEEELKALDMSEEAAESGRATVQAYLAQAEGMLPQVRAAFGKVAATAVISMGYIPYSDSAYHANGNTGMYGGFASGTQNAPPGWAWVGEEGPELMRLHGGEQILPNHVSRQAAADYSAYSRYTAAQGVRPARLPLEVAGTAGTAAGRPGMELHFHIEAGASPETVNAWQDYASRGGLKAAILEVMEEAGADTRRRVMG